MITKEGENMEKRTCKNCANMSKDGKKCRTMKRPVKHYACWGDAEMVREREQDIMRYNYPRT